LSALFFERASGFYISYGKIVADDATVPIDQKFMFLLMTNISHIKNSDSDKTIRLHRWSKKDSDSDFPATIMVKTYTQRMCRHTKRQKTADLKDQCREIFNHKFMICGTASLGVFWVAQFFFVFLFPISLRYNGGSAQPVKGRRWWMSRPCQWQGRDLTLYDES
jgi:hypothetical protein